MALPASTPDFAPRPKAVKAATPPDARKVAAQDLANAQKALFDAEDALAAAQANLDAKTKALAAVRKAPAAGKRP